MFFDFIHLMCFSVMLAEDPTETARRPPPTFEINRNENYLYFNASPPTSLPHCWEYMFQYSKCNEKPVTLKASKDDNWVAKVEYEAACRYAVQVQAQYLEYCVEGEQDSGMSKPVYFGQDGDPNLPFQMSMIIIPVLLCLCLMLAIVLFMRYKDKFLPKIPSPSDYLKEMFGSNQDMTRGLYVGDLYVPNEEVVEQLHVEPETTHIHKGF